jgi:hypothetical protein
LPESGEILGADMELNMADILPFKTAEPLGGDDYDLLSVITHEAGHFLGLAHSDVPSSTMYSDVKRGQSYTRRLTPDDIGAICEAYRPNGDRTVLDKKLTGAPQCNPTPRNGFSSECADAPSGCSVGRRGSSGFGVVLSLLAFAARKRARRSAAVCVNVL